MVASEIGVMVGQCLDRRIPDKAMLVSEIAKSSGSSGERAREKLGRAYPRPACRARGREDNLV